MKKGKTRILAIVGASGSGKTTLANYLQRECRIPTIISYTTRPMRPGETEGVEHLFVNECTAPQEELLAYTKYGDYFYWTELTQVKAHDVCTYVIDELGLERLIAKHGDDFEVISILVQADPEELAKRVDAERLKRDEGRLLRSKESYDLMIDNTGMTEEEFLKKSAILIETYLWQH